MKRRIPDLEIVTYPLSRENNISSFCSSNKDLNDFLKNDACYDQEQLISKTYVCYYQDKLAGYFTLTTDTIQVRSIDDKDCVDDFPYSKYPAVKLARLATHKDIEGRGVGSYMLHIAIYLTQKVSEITGCRYITVDTKPESLSFYTKHGFKLVKETINRDYPVLYLNMYPIIKGLESTESADPFSGNVHDKG